MTEVSINFDSSFPVRRDVQAIVPDAAADVVLIGFGKPLDGVRAGVTLDAGTPIALGDRRLTVIGPASSPPDDAHDWYRAG